jgi:phosphatidylglycerophosphatase A
VIDEVAGQMVACALFLAFVPSSALLPWLLAFLLFRLFDIFKPWPVGALEKLPPPAAGIMADDIAAGLMAGGLVAAFFAS